MALSEPSQDDTRTAPVCSICLNDFKIPKLLPCLHTFCQDCLIKYCHQKRSDLIPCPLCTTEFSLPDGGVAQLPDNDFMTRLYESTRGKQRQNTCEQCRIVGEEIVAESFCMDCKQNMCRRCKMLHTSISMTKHHKIVTMDEKPTEHELKRLMSNYCSKHSNKEVELYCCDCRILVCVLCHATDHSKHMCKVPHDVAKEMKAKLEKYWITIEESISETKDQIHKLKKENQHLARQISQTNSAAAKVNNQYQDSHDTTRLNGSVTARVNLKEGESRLDLEELHYTELESFLSYSRIVVERGTDCEIIRAAGDLNKRAEDLIKGLTDQQGAQASSTDQQIVKYIKPAAPSPAELQKLLGTVVYRDFNRMHLGDQSMLKAIQHCVPVRGLTAVCDRTFVVRKDQPKVYVYDSHNLAASRNINIPGMTSPEGLAGCAYNRALYISDQSPLRLNCIHRVDLTNNSVTRWEMRKDHVPCGLSVTAEHTLLVTTQIRGTGGQCGVVEYTSEGQQVREIRFDRRIKEAHHTLKLSSDQLIVCHGSYGSLQHRVCLINEEGQVIRSYGGEEGGNKGHLNYPSSLSVHSNGQYEVIFVADCVNHRILLLSGDLTYLGQVNTTHDLNRPYRLYFDSTTGRLCVGELSGRVSVRILAP